MKRMLIISILLIMVLGLLGLTGGKDFKILSSAAPMSNTNDIEHQVRVEPGRAFIVPPTNIMTSYYDYMIGGYNNTPLCVQPDPTFGGHFFTFQGSRTPSGTRRVFYVYIDDNGVVQNCNELSAVQRSEGFPAIAIDPITGKPFYAWQVNSDTDTALEVLYAYDGFLGGAAGLISDPLLCMNNPIALPAPYNTNDNEFILPSVQVGPSPIAGMRRVYILTRNATAHNGTTGYPCENVRIAYADFNENMLEMGSQLNWSYTSIPELDAWNHDTLIRRKLNYSLSVGNDGKLYYMGYHTATLIATGQPVIEQDLDVFVCTNYGQGAWQRYSANSSLPSWNPPTSYGSGPGFFKHNNTPYLNNQLNWKISHSEHINSVYDETNNTVHCSAMWCLTNSDNQIYTELNTIKEFVFDANSLQFIIREIYPKSSFSSDNLFWQPWDMDGNISVDSYDTSGNPFIATHWNFPYWDESCGDSTMVTRYNNIKVTKPNSQGWMAAVWQSSWRARQYHKSHNTFYQPYANVPEIYVSLSTDFGYDWRDPIVINSADVAQFSGIKPMWVYPADKIQNMGIGAGKLALMFYDDHTWGSFSETGTGDNDGGVVKFTVIDLAPFPHTQSVITGCVRNSANNEPLQGVSIQIENQTSFTDYFGEYNIYSPSGIVNVIASKPGFITQTITGILVTAGSTVTVDFVLIPIPVVNVTGLISGGVPSVPLSGVIITLTGDYTHTVMSYADGHFTIPGVLTNHTYQYSFSKTGFTTLTGYINVEDGDYSFGEINLYENIIPPTTLQCLINYEDDSINLEWSSPQDRDSDKQVRASHSQDCSGRAIVGYTIWRFLSGQEATFTDWILVGSYPSSAESAQDTSWSTLPENAYRYAINTQYANNQSSNYTFSPVINRYVYGTLSGYVRDVDNYGITGATVTLNREFPDGNGPYTVTSNNQGFYSFDNVRTGRCLLSCVKNGYQPSLVTYLLISGNQISICNISLRDSLYCPVNVIAAVNQTNMIISWQPPEQIPARNLTNYAVWRLSADQENNPQNWFYLNSQVSSLSYTDINWDTAAPGSYKYAVKAVYSGQYFSDPVFSNIVEKTVYVTDEEDDLAVNKILGCHPNPFVASTRINYSIKKPGMVQLEIFNLQGQIVRTLSQKNITKGINNLSWNGEDINGHKLPSGIYLIKMKANGIIDYSKVMLLK